MDGRNPDPLPTAESAEVFVARVRETIRTIASEEGVGLDHVHMSLHVTHLGKCVMDELDGRMP